MARTAGRIGVYRCTASAASPATPAAPHALHMPPHIYSMRGIWEDSVRSNFAAKAAADDYAVQSFLDRTHPRYPTSWISSSTRPANSEEPRRATGCRVAPNPKEFFVAQLTIDAALASIQTRLGPETPPAALAWCSGNLGRPGVHAKEHSGQCCL